MHHECEQLHRISIFNLKAGVDNQGNEFWIFANGKPVESWKRQPTAESYFRSMILFHSRHRSRAVLSLHQCLPGVGFIPLQKVQT